MYALAQVCRCRHLLCGEVQYSLSACFGGVAHGVFVPKVSSSSLTKYRRKREVCFHVLKRSLSQL